MFATKEKKIVNPAPLSQACHLILDCNVYQTASLLNHHTINNTHLFLTLLESQILDEPLKVLGLDVRTFHYQVKNKIVENMGHGDHSVIPVLGPKIKTTIESAQQEAAMQGSRETEPHHLLAQILRYEDGFFSGALEALGINQPELLETVLKTHDRIKPKKVDLSPAPPQAESITVFQKLRNLLGNR
ncbi:MAG: Clp protease N-terminal domain-containing protein [bacterium]|nr:Clp protease N-terminal domain-containing protein [bacterium]